MNYSKPKFCYVLPEYHHQAHTHFAYLADFLSALSNFFDIFLIIERGEKPASNFGCQLVEIADSPSSLIRLIKTEALLDRKSVV